jgi:hypothetical protein
MKFEESDVEIALQNFLETKRKWDREDARIQVANTMSRMDQLRMEISRCAGRKTWPQASLELPSLQVVDLQRREDRGAGSGEPPNEEGMDRTQDDHARTGAFELRKEGLGPKVKYMIVYNKSRSFARLHLIGSKCRFTAFELKYYELFGEVTENMFNARCKTCWPRKGKDPTEETAEKSSDSESSSSSSEGSDEGELGR